MREKEIKKLNEENLEKFKKYDISGHVTLTKGERSALATLASEIL